VTREEPDTIADGIATGGLSELTFGLLKEHLDDVVVVSATTTWWPPRFCSSWSARNR